MFRDRLARWMRDARRWLERRPATPLRLVACRPLSGGAVVYVAEVDRRRLVFVAAPHAACLLAAYRIPHKKSAEEEVASSRV